MGFWFQLFVAFALNVVASLLLSKPQQSHRATAEKFSVPTTRHGGWPGVLAGTRTIEGAHVSWYGHTKAVPIKSKGGKK